MVHGAGPLARRFQIASAEWRMWADETVASGMVPYHHIVGAENGLGEDQRSLEPAARILQLDREARPAFHQQAFHCRPSAW